LVLAVLGLPQIFLHPEVLGALSPLPALNFIFMYGWKTMFFLGAVVLCVTGAEALYADMGHFGRRSITAVWLTLVYPALVINYFGQGARLLSAGEIPNEHLFYSLAPSWALIPLVILSTMATIIASQALISGAFSLTSQATALGVLPRLKTIHTNAKVEGQIYMPFVNLTLLVGCIFLVINFKTSGALAAAYGVAVTGAMVVTTAAFYLLARHQWHWPIYIVGPIGLVLLIIDITFFAANLLKITKGGYIPLVIAVCLFFIMHAWQWGRKRVTHAYAELPGLTVNELIEAKQNNKEHLLHRSVVVMASRPIFDKSDRIPVALDSFCHKWGSAIPKHVILFNVSFVNKPRVSRTDRYKITILHEDPEIGTVSFVQVFYGYMQTPFIRDVLEELKEKKKIHIPADPSKWLVLVGAERFTSRPRRLLDRIRLAVFRSIMMVSKPVTSYLGLGSDPQVAIETVNI